MMLPFSANKIEQLDTDPVKKINGYVWFNTVEKVFKTWIDDELHVFITSDITNVRNIDEIVYEIINKKQFYINFENTYSITIQHNRNSKHFIYSIFDSNNNTQINAQMEILNENEVRVEFVDPISGNLFMYFA